MKLPAEDQDTREHDMCVKLVAAMYGTGDAAQSWQRKCAETVHSSGFPTLEVSPCHFYHRKRGVCGVVHGGGCLRGISRHLERIATHKSSKFNAKVASMFQSDWNELRVLDRDIKRAPRGIRYDSGHRHADKLLNEAGLAPRQVVATPAVHESRKARRTNVKPQTPMHECRRPVLSSLGRAGGLSFAPVFGNLGRDLGVGRGGGGERRNASTTTKINATKFRANGARCKFFCSDRSNWEFVANEAPRSLATPHVGDMGIFMRIAKHLNNACSRLVQQLPLGKEGRISHECSNSDQAGFSKSRKSTIGGGLLISRRFAKHWSARQRGVALSSAGGISEAKGLSSLGKHFGEDLEIVAWADAQAAIVLRFRSGRGKARHIESAMRAQSCFWVDIFV